MPMCFEGEPTRVDLLRLLWRLRLLADHATEVLLRLTSDTASGTRSTQNGVDLRGDRPREPILQEAHDDLHRLLGLVGLDSRPLDDQIDQLVHVLQRLLV
jgi:hypothetical protein